MRQTNRGFTLIEVLIATLLLAVIGMVMMTTISSSITLKENVTGMSSRYQAVQQAMMRMSRELSMAFISGHKDVNNSLIVMGFVGDSDKVSFDAFGNQARAANARQSDILELSYFLGDDNKTKKRSLMRRRKAARDGEFDKGGKSQLLCPGVTKLEFAYWDDKKSAFASEWDASGAGTFERLPSRISISLTATMDDGQEKKFYTETRVWLTAPVLVQ